MDSRRYAPLGAIPRLIDETDAYAVLYKPPLMFSAPLSDDPAGTLLGWFSRRCPAVLDAGGPRSREGGLLHRLDFETEGLVLCAKNRETFEFLRSRQRAGEFIKEYGALSSTRAAVAAPGFPPIPPALSGEGFSPHPPHRIESYFRPWGPGRKAVRPVIQGPPPEPGKRARREIARDGDHPYRTEILSAGNPPCPGPQVTGNLHVFTLQLHRGFRHQIRCHLAWIGEPILNDTLYGGTCCPLYRPSPRPGEAEIPAKKETLPIALRAQGFRFPDPATGTEKEYRLPGFAG
ncbi:MAG: RNA pseudouridine synthase [Treponema sp.]|jgi:23S rRNA pseudouridine1911/1915/1917 synthase|nr:RNA pseudouridine synthase [Treponema sp.]